MLLVIISRLRNGVALHLIKLESISPENILCQDWLELGMWFLGRRSLKSCQCFDFYIFALPGKECCPLFEKKIECPSFNDALWSV